MRSLYRFIIIAGLVFSPVAQAVELFMDALYWRAAEPEEWAYTNNLNVRDHQIKYRTFAYPYSPGWRVGAGFANPCWDTKFYYTGFYTSTNGSAHGNLIPGLLAGKLDLPFAGYFYSSGHANIGIHFNMLDWDLGKSFCIYDGFDLHPIIGLRGGSINQNMHVHFYGPVTSHEKVQNHFAGLGPKLGIDGKIRLFSICNYQLGAVAEFATAYLWGHWKIHDVLHDSLMKKYIVKTASRNYGALAFQGMLGASIDYKNISVKLGYEINDWFNQFQVFDDGTGSHTNNLILQGATLNVTVGL